MPRGSYASQEVAEAVGRTITLSGEPFAIIGIIPSRFGFPGILRCERAQANINVIARRLEQAYRESNTDRETDWND